MIAMTKHILFQGGLSPGLSHRKNADNPIGDKKANLVKNHCQSLEHNFSILPKMLKNNLPYRKVINYDPLPYQPTIFQFYLYKK